MPKGPKGQKRPADVIGNAVGVMEIATGQREEEYDPADEGKDQAAAELGRRGGKARAEKMTPTRLCRSQDRADRTGSGPRRHDNRRKPNGMLLPQRRWRHPVSRTGRGRRA